MVVPLQGFVPPEIIPLPKYKMSSKKVYNILQEDSRFVAYMNRSLAYLRWAGAYPLEHRAGVTVISLYLLVFNLILNFVFFPATAIAIHNLDFLRIAAVIRVMNLVIFMLSSFLFSFRIIRGHSQMGDIFKMLESTEKRMSGLGTYFAYGNPPTFFTLLAMLFWFCSVVLKSVISGPEKLWGRLIVYYMQLLHSFNLFGLSSLLYAVEVQFSNCKDHLLWIVSNPTHRWKKVEFCESLVEIHEDICAICSDIGNFYSFQLLFTETVGFISFVANAYICVVERDSLIKMVISFLDALIGLMQASMICSSSVKIGKKAKEFNTLLYQLMIDDKTNEISQNKKLRLHIAMKREVVFSACGFFNLDYTLIHSMVAAATTYLVILIQFGQTDDLKTTIATNITNITKLISTTEIPQQFTNTT